jgi:hypothetical protein
MKRRVWPVGIALALALLSSAPRAEAEESGPRYGGQTLLADGASLALVTVGAILPRGSTVDAVCQDTGFFGYLLATPVIHAAHRRWDMFGLSLGMRVLGIPLVSLLGAVVGYAAWHPKEPATSDYDGTRIDNSAPSPYDGAVIGLVAGLGVGIITVTVLDAAVLAREKRPSSTPAAPHAAPAPSLRLTPSLSFARGGGTVGLGGTF